MLYFTSEPSARPAALLKGHFASVPSLAKASLGRVPPPCPCGADTSRPVREPHGSVRTRNISPSGAVTAKCCRAHRFTKAEPGDGTAQNIHVCKPSAQHVYCRQLLPRGLRRHLTWDHPEYLLSGKYIFPSERTVLENVF